MNTENIKQSHNIADYINQYVPLKRTGTGEFAALCPFHSEKTPSFTVSEGKQFYHCFGCGANGDIIKFVEQYQGVEFIDACKILGGEVDEMDLRTVSANRARPIISYPKFDKRDEQQAFKILNKKSECHSMDGLDVHLFKGDFCIPIVDLDIDKSVNVYNARNGKFSARGVSHRAASIIRRCDKPEYIICVDFNDGLNLARLNNESNIMIAYSAFNLQLIVNSFDYNFTPAITADDTHAHSLTESHDYIFISDDGFVEKGMGEDYE